MFDDLLERWRRHPPEPMTLERLAGLLESRFRAYRIPVEPMAEDFANDEEVREGLVVALYTITHREVLDRLYDDEARALQAGITADEVDEYYWRTLFDDGDLAYSLLVTQHALGQRSSVVLECEGEVVTGFKVYGHSGPLHRQMLAWVGFPERPPGPLPSWPTMVRGDLADLEFVGYLRALASTGAI